jgi:hypothetical protein
LNERKKHHEIPLNFEKQGILCPCKVGGLLIYPRSNRVSVFVRGEDIYPEFHGMTFGFRIQTKNNFLVAQKIFSLTEYGRKIYTKHNQDFNQNIFGLMNHAINLQFEAPFLSAP